MKLQLEIEPCETLNDACEFAQALADRNEHPVESMFNSVLCIAQPGGCKMKLAGRYREASSSYLTVYSGSSDEIEVRQREER